MNHLGGNQEPKVGTDGQASHGLGAPPAQGGHHQAGHGGDEEEGVEREPWEAAKSQPTSPAGTPGTSGREHPRVVVTPLWSLRKAADQLQQQEFSAEQLYTLSDE